MEDPPKGFHRLVPGGQVRLRHAYVIRCDEIMKDARGEITELHCTYDPATLGRQPASGPVKGTIHWVSARHAAVAEVRLYDRLFRVPDPDAGEGDFTAHLNPESLVTVHGYIEPSVLQDPAETRYQFERLGYFWRDPIDSRPDSLVFNRIVTLRDSWSRIEEKSRAEDKRNSRPAQRAGAAPEAESRSPADAELTRAERSLLADLTARGVGEDEAGVLIREPRLASYFEEVARGVDATLAGAWVVHEIGGAIRAGSVKVPPDRLAALLALLKDATINTRIARDVLAEASITGDDPVEIVRRKGLNQVTEAATLEPIIDRLIAQSPDKVMAYRAGKTALAGYFVGQVMRETQGRANPQVAQELVARKLAAS
jgi:glutaminyl-tRNA synthetase